MMKLALNKSVTEEKGQALILVIILLLVGSLIIAPLLGFMSTGLLAGQVFEKKMGGLYAADAGIEDALWKIMNLAEIPTVEYYLTVNGMLVDVVIEEVTEIYGEYDVGGGGVHYDWFDLESEFLGYDGDESWGVYNYQLSLTNKKTAPVRLESVTVSYSTTLSYLSGLTNGDIGGLAPPPKKDFEDGTPTLPETLIGSFKILVWVFSTPYPQIEAAGDLEDPGTWVTVTTTFQLEGPPGAPEITAYLAVVSGDIGTIWEFKPFKITATAQADDGSTVVTTVTARALVTSTVTLISSWEID